MRLPIVVHSREGVVNLLLKGVAVTQTTKIVFSAVGHAGLGRVGIDMAYTVE